MDHSLNRKTGNGGFRRPRDFQARLDALAAKRASLYENPEPAKRRPIKRRRPEFGYDADGEVYTPRRFRAAESLFQDGLPDGRGYRRVG